MTNSQPSPVMKPAFAREELPLRVRDAAIFLGVSPQTVYLWVERKADSPSPRDGPQHPILEIGVGALPRAVQTGGGELARPVKHDGGLYKREGSKIWWMRY